MACLDAVQNNRTPDTAKFDKNGTADNQGTDGADKALDVEECPHCHKFVSKGGCARKTVRFLVDFWCSLASLPTTLCDVTIAMFELSGWPAHLSFWL